MTMTFYTSTTTTTTPLHTGYTPPLRHPMALLINEAFATPSGYVSPSTYWRWVGLGVDVTTTTATITLYAYIDEAAFNTGKQSVASRTFTVTGEAFRTLTSPVSEVLSTAIYTHAKGDAQFGGAVDA